MTKENNTVAEAASRMSREGTMASWIALPFGIFYPAVRPPRTIKSGDAQTLQVRTRRREYLDALRQWCPELGEPQHNPAGHAMDYPWRSYIRPEDFALAVARIILAHDSEVFKPLTDGPCGLQDRKLASELHGAYNAMWGVQLDRLSDGTSSYDKWSGAAGHVVTPPDPDAPVKLCREHGHQVRRGAGVRVCVDCKSRRGKDGAWQHFQPIFGQTTGRDGRAEDGRSPSEVCQHRGHHRWPGTPQRGHPVACSDCPAKLSASGKITYPRTRPDAV